MNFRTRQLDQSKWVEMLVKHHKKSAELGEWDGKGPDAYFKSCHFTNPFRGITTLFTRDVGYHSSGWWKNPDFERCLHLSVSFFDPTYRTPVMPDRQITAALVQGFFGKDKRWVWVEPPYTPDGKRKGVMHYRLFCDAGWNPIKPRGEVYSKELTEAGWHSFSDLREAVAKSGRNPNRGGR